MGISRPRFSIAGMGGGLYIAADGYLTGTQNSQQQNECRGADQNEGGDSSPDGAGNIEDPTVGQDTIVGVGFDLIIQDIGRRQAHEKIEAAEKAAGRELSIDEKLEILFDFAADLRAGIQSLKSQDAALAREVAEINNLGFGSRVLAIPRAWQISNERASIQRAINSNGLRLRGVELAKAQVLGRMRRLPGDPR
jgi:hypothetical protein